MFSHCVLFSQYLYFFRLFGLFSTCFSQYETPLRASAYSVTGKFVWTVPSNWTTSVLQLNLKQSDAIFVTCAFELLGGLVVNFAIFCDRSVTVRTLNVFPRQFRKNYHLIWISRCGNGAPPRSPSFNPNKIFRSPIIFSCSCYAPVLFCRTSTETHLRSPEDNFLVQTYLIVMIPKYFLRCKDKWAASSFFVWETTHVFSFLYVSLFTSCCRFRRMHATCSYVVHQMDGGARGSESSSRVAFHAGGDGRQLHSAITPQIGPFRPRNVSGFLALSTRSILLTAIASRYIAECRPWRPLDDGDAPLSEYKQNRRETFWDNIIYFRNTCDVLSWSQNI